MRLSLVLLASSALAAAQSGVAYRLLSARESTSSPVREIDYNISVDQYLDVSGVKDVICRMVRAEKPNGFEVLSTGIYYKLDQHSPDSDVADVAELRQRRIAQYHWNKDSPKDSRRLVLSRDAKGQALPEWRFYDFDHSKACR
jgi:hypothetical protein